MTNYKTTNGNLLKDLKYQPEERSNDNMSQFSNANNKQFQNEIFPETKMMIFHKHKHHQAISTNKPINIPKKCE